jgi:excisionase family DNA binding protein
VSDSLAYDIATAAQVSGVSPDTIRRAIHATQGATLTAKKVGRKYLIPRTALEAWLTNLPDA